MDPIHDRNELSCDTSDEPSKSYKLHMNPNHSINSNSCDISDNLSNSSHIHMDPTHGKNSNSCKNGGKLSNRLGIHIEQMHIKNCSCYKCQKNLTNVKNLAEHESIDHARNEKEIWIQYNNEFTDIIKPLKDSIAKSLITPDQAGTEFNNLLTTFLESKPNLVKNVKTFLNTSQQRSTTSRTQKH